MKTVETGRMLGKSYQERKAHAQTVLRAALAIPRRDRTQGKAIAVFDDVFTDGQTLNEVARALRTMGGAADVVGIALARQPYRGPA